MSNKLWKEGQEERMLCSWKMKSSSLALREEKSALLSRSRPCDETGSKPLGSSIADIARNEGKFQSLLKTQNIKQTHTHTHTKINKHYKIHVIVICKLLYMSPLFAVFTLYERTSYLLINFCLSGIPKNKVEKSDCVTKLRLYMCKRERKT